MSEHTEQATITDQWRVHYVAEDCPQDEQPGWYVVGGPAWGEHQAVIHVGHPVDLAGAPAGQRLAWRIAEVLALDPEGVAPDRVHTVSRFAELWAALTGRAPRSRCGAVLTGPAPYPPVRRCPDCDGGRSAEAGQWA